MYLHLADAWRTFKLDHCELSVNLRRSHALGYANFSDTKFLEVQEKFQYLYDWIDFVNAHSHVPHKRVISWNCMYIYTNDEQFVGDIVAQSRNITQSRQCQVTRADVCLPPDVVVLKHTRHHIRTYLRDVLLQDSQAQAFVQFLHNQTQWTAGRGLQQALRAWRARPAAKETEPFWCRRYFFVDHDTPQDLLFLNLVAPNIVSRSLPIISRCDK